MSYTDSCDWSQCTRCGECLTLCPVLKMDKTEARQAVDELLDGGLPARVQKDCTLCFNCNSLCPEGLRPHDLILSRMLENRKKPVSAGLPYLMNGMPGPNLFRDMYDRLSKEENEILDRWSLPPEPCPEALWVGCVGRVSCLDLDNSQVLADLPKYGPRELCCGELQYRMGSYEVFEKRIESTFEQLAALKVDRLVSYCASCATFLRVILPKAAKKELPYPVISLYEWLLEKVEAGELASQKPLPYRAAVSESCYVTELGPEFAEKLRKLYRAAGMEVAELPHHGLENLSCGAVSFGKDQNILKSVLKVQAHKFSDLKKSGENALALNCPGCFLTLMIPAKTRRVTLRYMPDELLKAFGDEPKKPLSSRLPLLVRTLTRRAPLFVKKADPDIFSK